MGAADDTGNPDSWADAVRVVGDPWVVAAARSGDGRAMRCLAHRAWHRRTTVYRRLDTAAKADLAAGLALANGVSPDRPTREIQVLETARWFAEAARHGDSPARAELDSYLRDEHFAQHLARVPTQSRWRRTRTPQECRAGAEQGYASCMLRWAAQLRALGPDHDMEAEQWLARAPHGKRDLPTPPATMAAPGQAAVTIVLTAVVTAAVVPFVQAMVTKAGEDSYNGLRRWLLEVFGGVLPPRHKPDGRDQLLIISPSPDRQPAALLQVWTDLPDEAITALSQLLYDMRLTQSTASDTGKRWYWNTSSHRWELLQLPQDHGSHGDTASST